jgi:hypothetical protein
VPTRRSPRLVAGAAIVGAALLVVVAVGIAGLGRATLPPPSDPPPSDASRASDAASPRVVIDSADCAMSKAPAADDPSLPPFGDGPFDPVDISPAWLRICLTGPVPRSAEVSAFCVWNDGRTRVTDVEALPKPGDPMSASISPDGDAVFLHVAGVPDGTDYVKTSQPILADIEPSAPATGAARLELQEERPPSSTATTALGTATGTMRWDCGVPPAPRPGRSTGQVRLHLDAPIDRDVTIEVSCSWDTRPTGPEVDSIATGRLAALGALQLGITIEPVLARPDQSQLGLSVSDQTNATDYRPAAPAIVAALGPGGATGTLRFIRMTADGDAPRAPGPRLDGVDATVMWACDAPAVEGPHRPADQRGDHPTRGIATLTFAPPIAPPITGPITCYLNPDDPQSVQAGEISGTIDVGGGARVTLSESAGDVLVGLVGADGTPAGEYHGTASQIADDALHPIRIEVGDLAWSPVDPRYVPLGGAAGPRSLDLTIEASCDIASAHLPGIGVGSMDVRLGSGLDRSWSVPAVCHWRIVDGGPRVTIATNLGPLDLAGQGLIVQAVPELLITVDGFGTSYGSSPRSTIAGSVATDGSSGDRTFTSFEPRRKITNVNGRIGGRGGVVAVDGSIHWDCGAPPAVVPVG